MQPISDIAGFPALFDDDSEFFGNKKPAAKKGWFFLALLVLPVICVLTLTQ